MGKLIEKITKVVACFCLCLPFTGNTVLAVDEDSDDDNQPKAVEKVEEKLDDSEENPEDDGPDEEITEEEPEAPADDGQEIEEPIMLLNLDSLELHVSSTGNDETGEGTKDNPYSTLTHAVEVASDGAIIYVDTDLTITSCARFYDKNLTIDGQGHTVTRGENFAAQQDNARSTYNPAMIEVDGNQPGTVTSSLTLKNITLDDAGKKIGTYFVQAEASSFSHTDVVQDAMIATYNGVGTITLGNGTTLKNFGGMSAIRVAGGTLVMESGSKICDDTVTDRSRGGNDDNGPAGAIWVQGGTVTMNNGSEISNVTGRAIYVDSGTVSMGGTISNIKYDSDMWNDQGTAIHIRNGASVTMTNGGVIKEVAMTMPSSKGKAEVYLCKTSKFTMQDGSAIQDLVSQTVAVKVNGNSTFEMQEGSVIKNLNDHAVLTGDADDYGNIIEINGEVTGQTTYEVTGQTTYTATLQFSKATVTVGPSANIHDNKTSYGACYLQDQVKLYVYGKINNNSSDQHGGAIGASGQGYEYIEALQK